MGKFSHPDFAALNEVKQYSQFLVFDVIPGVLPDDRSEVIDQLHGFFAGLKEKGITVRGVYNISGVRAEGDYMIWWHAENLEDLQDAYNQFRRETILGAASEKNWIGTSIHRPAEFNKSHLPAFIMGMEPDRWITVYPFVRSYDWYLLDPNDRRKILADHGQAGRKFGNVLANTMSAFALGDYEWILAFEAPDMETINELMHAMRYTKAREHVRVEIPFYSGRRVDDIAEIVNVLP